MIKEQERFQLKDLNGVHDIKIDVQWNKGSEKLAKLTIGDKQSVIKIVDLYKFVFVACDAEQQDDLLPMRQTQVRKYIKQHKVQVKKNLKPGDFLVVNCEIDVPLTVTEGLNGSLKTKKSSFLI